MNRLEAIVDKICSKQELSRKLKIWRMQSASIVFTNGVFDIIHKGHVHYLAEAASKGNRLVIGLNSDDSVKMLGKGNNRPIQDQNSRAFILAGLGFVDAVCQFDESTPIDLIKFVSPDILVKGGDYSIQEIVGHEFVLNNGGEVQSIPLIEGYSTTAIENKIRKDKI